MSLLHAICPLWSFDDRDWPDYLGSSTLLKLGERYHFITTNELALGLDATRTTNFTFAGYPRTHARPAGRAPLRPSDSW